MLLATVIHAMLRRVAFGFIPMTTSKLFAYAPRVSSSGSMSRSQLTRLFFYRVFSSCLRSFVIHDVRSFFGRMLQMRPVCKSTLAMQNAAVASRGWFDESKFDRDDEYAELCVIAEPILALLRPKESSYSQRKRHGQSLGRIQLLLQYRADANTKGECGNTALMDAAFQGCESVVLLLLQYKADVNASEIVEQKGFIIQVLRKRTRTDSDGLRS